MAGQLAYGYVSTAAERIRELKETPNIIPSGKDESNVSLKARELYPHHEP